MGFGERIIEIIEIVLCQRHIHRSEVFLEAMQLGCAGDGNHVLSSSEHPGQSQLRGRDLFLRGEGLNGLHNREVVFKVFALKTRRGSPVVIVFELVEVLDGTGQEATTKRAVRNKCDAERFTCLHHLAFMFSGPQRILALQRRDWMHSMCASDLVGVGLTQPEIAHLARLEDRRDLKSFGVRFDAFQCMDA